MPLLAYIITSKFLSAQIIKCMILVPLAHEMYRVYELSITTIDSMTIPHTASLHACVAVQKTYWGKSYVDFDISAGC